MPADDPNLAAIATTAAFGAAGGGLLVLSKPMTRREVYYNVLSAVVLAATVPQVVVHYVGVHPVAGWLLGLLCGLSAPVIVNQLQMFTVGWLKKRSNEAIKP